MAWYASGWRGNTVLQYSLALPGGSYGSIWRRNINATWSFTTRDMDRRQGAYKRRSAAQAACENQLRHELREGLKALRRLPRPPRIVIR